MTQAIPALRKNGVRAPQSTGQTRRRELPKLKDASITFFEQYACNLLRSGGARTGPESNDYGDHDENMLASPSSAG